MPTEFKWTKKLQAELDAINKFIREVPSVKTIWLESDVFDLLFNALKYPDANYLQIGIPYDGKTLKCINFYGIKGSQ